MKHTPLPPGRPRLPATPATCLAAALAAAFPALPALAQDNTVNEIIVTVRQRAESIQDVPGVVSNFGTEQIQKLGIERARDFVNQTAGVSIVTTSAEVGDSQVNIRGINGARDAETNYALVIDGILMTNPAALNREYTNLEQIQIFKGPQSAIYGRNAAAGAFVINTQEPGEEWGGRVRGSFAQDDTYVLSGNVGGAVSDTLRLGFTGSFRDSDGYYRNAFRRSQGSTDTAIVDNFQSWDLTGRAIWQPTEALKLDAKLRYGEVDAASIAFNSVFQLPAFTGLLGPAANQDVNTWDFQFDNNIVPTNNQEATEFSLKADYDLGWADLTAWGLYSDIKNDLTADGTSGAFGFFNDEPRCQSTTADLTGYPLAPPQYIGPSPVFPNSLFGAYTPTSCDGTQYQQRDQKDYSFEARLASKGDQRLRWLGGVYFLDLERTVGVNTGIDLNGTVARTLYAGPGSNNPTEALVADRFDTNVYAVFGQLAYDVTDTLEASLAVRYDREERKATSLVPTDAVTQFIDTCGDGGAGDPINPGLCDGGNLAPQKETFSEFQPKFSLTWDAFEHSTFYGSVGVGFKSGGFNNQGSAATVNRSINQPLIYGIDPDEILPPGDPSDPTTWYGPFSSFAPVLIDDVYDEETSVAYELGVKSRFLDNRLRTEVALFRTDVDDMQFFEFFVGGFGLLRVVSNIDEVELQGFELSANYQANDWLTLFASYAYTDSEIKENVYRPDTVGNKAPYTPDWTGNVGAQVQYPMSSTLDFVGSVDARIVGDTWFHVVQTEDRPTGFGAPANYTQSERDAYAVVNLRAGVQAEAWSVTAYITNLFEENYLEEVIPAPEFGGSFISPGTLRRFGVEAQFRF